MPPSVTIFSQETFSNIPSVPVYLYDMWRKKFLVEGKQILFLLRDFRLGVCEI